jgi:hypothetical protein
MGEELIAKAAEMLLGVYGSRVPVAPLTAVQAALARTQSL